MNQHVLRLETDYRVGISNLIKKQFFELISSKSEDYDSILILDYGIGLFQDKFVHDLLKKIRESYNAPIIARPNFNNYYLYEGIDMIRLNLQKALQALSIECCNDRGLIFIGQKCLEPESSHATNQ